VYGSEDDQMHTLPASVVRQWAGGDYYTSLLEV
jgi:hypothetical protein